jgi:hypothetical protein
LCGISRHPPGGTEENDESNMYCAYGHNPKIRGIPFSTIEALHISDTDAFLSLVSAPLSVPKRRYCSCTSRPSTGGFRKLIAEIIILFIHCGSLTGVVIDTDSVT